MKHIFGTGAYGEPYHVELDDDTLYDARCAQHVLRTLPWEGEMFIPCSAKRLGGGMVLDLVEIVVTKRVAWLSVEGPESRENLIDSHDLFNLPDIYLTKSFENDLIDNMLELDSHEIDLIASWKERLTNKLENNE
jgi:hypothetical protein